MNRNCVILFIIISLLFYSCLQTKANDTNIKPEKEEEVAVTPKATFSNFEFINLKDDFEDDESFDGAEGFVEPDELTNNPKVINNNKVYYVVEGDILMNRSEYIQYKSQKDSLTVFNQKLIGIIIDDQIVKQPEHLDIKYAIIKASFRNNIREYELIKKNMKQAAKDWEGLCNVKFQHLSGLDATLSNNDNPETLTFVVKKRKTNAYTAAAFFPHYTKERRKLRISPRYFLSSYDQVGILRHEIGHILGYLHEHIRAEAPDCRENTTYRVDQITKYNPESVMHYFCNGIGDKRLKFTDLDTIGAREYYPFK